MWQLEMNYCLAFFDRVTGEQKGITFPPLLHVLMDKCLILLLTLS